MMAEQITSAMGCHRAGDFRGAVSGYEQVIVDPQFEELLPGERGRILALLGAACLQCGDFSTGEGYLQRAALFVPAQADVWSNLGLSLGHLNRAVEAVEAYRRAAELKPEDARSHVQLGDALQMAGDPEAALLAYEAALARHPEFSEAYYNRGVALQSLGRREEALQSYREAIARNPDYVEAYNNAGTLLDEQGQWGAARVHFDRVLALRPTHAGAYANRGRLREVTDDLPGALVDYGESLKLAPDNPGLAWNRALLMLKCGRYQEGWPLHERAERRLAAQAGGYVSGAPLWDGQAPIAGKTLLIRREQGFGDALQFARYALQIAASGGRVVLAVPAPLVRILQTLPCQPVVIAEDKPPPPHDYQCWMLSLPYLFRTTLETIPAPPYLFPDPEAIGRWATRMSGDERPKVGVLWAGRPAAAMDGDRSFPLATLAPVLNETGLCFYSLQKDDLGDERRRELQESPWADQMIDWTPELKDFHETAALIMNLDLVITADTAVLHLAGAMAKPVWLIDRKSHCWRWLAGRTDSPWYPSLTIFRQQKMGEWDAPVASVKATLQAHWGSYEN